MNDFHPYDRVEIVTDRFAEEGVTPGMVGYVIERWDSDAFEVEVMRNDGSTLAQFVANSSDLRLSAQEDTSN